MPPKAKTPLKASSEDKPQLEQVLAMLQAMSAQINGLSSRMETMEKKSEAAHERAGLGEQLPEGQKKRKQPMKGRAWESNSLKGEERKTSRREAYDEATALLGNTAAAKISASIKAIMQIVGTAKSSSKKNEQAEYVETIQMAFETTLMGEIVSRNDQI
jgi:hypothetical protein